MNPTNGHRHNLRRDPDRNVPDGFRQPPRLLRQCQRCPAVPDVVALAASGDPGIVDVSSTTNAGAFAVATVNLGSDDNITATTNTNGTTLPISINVCQTVPATGACMSPPAASVTTDIQPNATPTFGIFVSGTGSVPFDPSNNRVFVQFTDSGGVVRGATSVAVRTQ
jgi:hypothetical protein